MHNVKDYFPEELKNVPYADAKESMRDYFELASLLIDMGTDWRDELDADGDILPRGIHADGDLSLFQKAKNYYSVTPEDRNEPPTEDIVRERIGAAFSHIASREKATISAAGEDEGRHYYDILRMRSIADAFSLTKRKILILSILCVLRRDTHVAEALAYILGDREGLKTGTTEVGLIDTLIHLAFTYEERQPEFITDKRDRFVRYLLDISDEDAPPLRRKMKVNDAVYRYLLFGRNAFDIKPVRIDGGHDLYFDDFAETLSAYEETFNDPDMPTGFCYVESRDPGDVRYVLSRVFSEMGIPLYSIQGENINEKNKEIIFDLRMDSFLSGARLLVIGKKTESEDKKVAEKNREELTRSIRFLEHELPRMHTIYLAGEERMPSLALEGNKVPGVISLPLPDMHMRLRIWEDLLALNGIICGDDIDLSDIADCHALSFTQMKRVVEQCRSTLKVTSDEGILERRMLQEFIFALSTVDFEHLATYVPARYTWDDIYLEESQKKHLKYACDRYRLRNRVGEDWGLYKKNAYGNAVIVLMYGPPGTGKTMAAQVVANEVMTPLYRVDVSQIFSKYIGETQKNISRIFDEAQKRSVVLFFDEADALFTRRTEITDSHDKYANSDTSFLLQKVEEYNGISILATNNFQSFDPAFMRRLTYVVRFDRPDEATRKMMWETMLPKEVPMAADVDFEWFAQRFDDLSGSNIKSILLSACYMAAAEGGKVTMRHLVLATSNEFEKLGRLADPGVFDHYAVYLMD